MPNLQQIIQDQILAPHNPRRVNGITSLSIAEEWRDAHTCLECRKTLKRMNLTFSGNPFRPLPICECADKRFKQQQKEDELNKIRLKVKSIYGEGLIDSDLKKASFSNFEIRQGTEKAFEKARSFTGDFKKQRDGLYLFGSVGTGKSHLSAAIHNSLLNQGYASVFIDVSQLFGLAKSSFKSRDGKTDQDYIQAAIKCDVLTLDEIGLGSLTEYEFKLLFQIINGRKGKLTNFTSNLDLDRLEDWFKTDKYGNALDEDGRLFDRIIGSAQPIGMFTESYRRYQATQRLGAM